MFVVFRPFKFRTRTTLNWTLVNSMIVWTGLAESEHHSSIIIKIKGWFVKLISTEEAVDFTQFITPGLIMILYKTGRFSFLMIICFQWLHRTSGDNGRSGAQEVSAYKRRIFLHHRESEMRQSIVDKNGWLGILWYRIQTHSLASTLHKGSMLPAQESWK